MTVMGREKQSRGVVEGWHGDTVAWRPGLRGKGQGGRGRGRGRAALDERRPGGRRWAWPEAATACLSEGGMAARRRGSVRGKAPGKKGD